MEIDESEVLRLLDPEERTTMDEQDRRNVGVGEGWRAAVLQRNRSFDRDGGATRGGAGQVTFLLMRSDRKHFQGRR